MTDNVTHYCTAAGVSIGVLGLMYWPVSVLGIGLTIACGEGTKFIVRAAFNSNGYALNVQTATRSLRSNTRRAIYEFKYNIVIKTLQSDQKPQISNDPVGDRYYWYGNRGVWTYCGYWGQAYCMKSWHIRATRSWTVAGPGPWR